MELPSIFTDFQLYWESMLMRQKGMQSPHPHKHFKADLLCYLWHGPTIFSHDWLQNEMHSHVISKQGILEDLFSPPSKKVKWFCFYPQSPCHIWYHGFHVSFLFFPETLRRDSCIVKITPQENRCTSPSPRSCTCSGQWGMQWMTSKW